MKIIPLKLFPQIEPHFRLRKSYYENEIYRIIYESFKVYSINLLDLSEAFDKVTHQRPIYTLLSCVARGSPPKWIVNGHKSSSGWILSKICIGGLKVSTRGVMGHVLTCLYRRPP